MPDHETSPPQEFDEQSREDADLPEEDELSIEELEEAAGGTEPYQPPEANVAC